MSDGWFTIIGHCGEVRDKSFLDIGSNLGYFCLELAKHGAKTFGIETDLHRVEVARCIAKKLDLTDIMFFNDDAMEFVEITPVEFDYIILLNVFHHILIHDEPGGWRMFDKLINSTDGVFVMMRNSMRDWSLCSHPREIPQTIVATTAATNYKAYPPVHGRVIYVFWKE